MQDPDSGLESRAVLLGGALLVGAIAAAYANALGAPFLFDDLSAIARNPSIRQLWPPDAVLSPPTDLAGVVGRPVLNLSLALNYAWGGVDPRGYHAANVLIHALAALTFFGVMRRTLALPAAGQWLRRSSEPRTASPDPALLVPVFVAFCSALLWALHPLQTESVTFAIQRSESLASLFYLLTLYAFIRGVDSPRPWSWQIVSVAACVAGMGTKEIVATAPLIVLLFDRTLVAGAFKSAWPQRRWYYLALAGTWTLLAILVLQSRGRGGTAGLGLGVSSWDYLLTQARAIVLYLGLWVWPKSLVVDYGTALVRNFGEVALPFGIIAGLVAGSAVVLRRRSAMGLAGASFFLMLAPSSSIVPLTTQTIAEHRMYLPLAAITALGVVGLVHWLGPRVLAGVLALALAGGVLTVRRNEDYRSALTLWADTVGKVPANARAHYNYGNALSAAGRGGDAIAHYEAAFQIEPRYAAAHYNLAGTLLQLGRAEEAVAHYEAAVRLEPGAADTHANLAAALMRLGRMAEAVGHYEKAEALGLLAAEEQRRYGRALAEMGRLDAATARLESALRLDPRDAETHIVLGMVLSAAGRTPDALKHFVAAVMLKPADARAHCVLADALLETGHPVDALNHYETALRLQPDQAAGFHTSMGNALAQLGRAVDAVAHYEEALRLNPADAEAQANLAAVRAAAQRRGLLKK